MKIAAVVCEYHPFHNGHAWQLAAARSALGCDAIIGIMSGNFVQRGEPALFPKQVRAKAALQNGMDLVLELPAILTLQSAERYARNAVMTLDAMGCVDALFFGAECPDTSLLTAIAQVLADEDIQFRRQLQTELSAGTSFAVARANAVKAVLGPASAEILSHPNNILAVEYIKALLRLGSNIKPYAIKRKDAQHHDSTPSGVFASGSTIRQMLYQGEDPFALIPENTRVLIANSPRFSDKDFELASHASLCLKTPETLRQIADVAEGLEYALLKSAYSSQTLAQTIEQVKSKRYAYSRIRRILLNSYLGITQKDTDLLPEYIRILDFNDIGRQVLNHAKNTARLPLAKNGGQVKDIPKALALWQRELALDKVYQLFLRN